MKEALRSQMADALVDNRYTLKSLAEAANLHPLTLSRLIHGRTKPRLVTLWKLKRALRSVARTSVERG